MGKPKAAKLMAAIGLALIGALSSVSTVLAQQQQSSSTNYSVGQVHFGNGGDLSECSTNYCSKQSSGDLAAGATSSTNYQAQAGSNVDRDPYIQVLVNTASVNAGTLTTSTTGTGTATFSVKTYLASGYIVQTVGTPPVDGPHTMTAPSTPTGSTTGTEQFGINLVQNLTSCSPPAPVNFGANPVQVPSSSFSYGIASTGYDACGKFKYVNGDTIAQSSSSSGETDYTISYIMNISSSTPGGTYTTNQSIVATSTY